MKIELGPLRASDVKRIGLTEGGGAWNGDPALWTRCLEEQTDGRRKVIVGRLGSEILAYGSLVLESSYRPFAERGTPEISNLVVAEKVRRQGLATRLIASFETMARDAGRSEIGIGTGLYRDYGAAQRLYITLGYVPDGRGATYRGVAVKPGAFYPADDELVLWLSKPL